MMAWERNVNRELGDLNDAHSASRIDTSEYRQRRRALLNATLRLQGSALHTLRRPAGGAMPMPMSVATPLRAMPMRRAVSVRPVLRRWHGIAWWLGGTGLFLTLLAWMVMSPPF